MYNKRLQQAMICITKSRGATKGLNCSGCNSYRFLLLKLITYVGR